MKASEELVAARDELAAAILPYITAYEERTGLSVSEIAVDRAYVEYPVTEKEARLGPVSSIRVRTNASSL